MIKAGSVAWFARHELRLAWRDFVSMVTAGRRRRAIAALIGFVVFAVFMHGLALFMVGPFAGAGADPALIERDVLLYVTVIGLLAWALLVSQALEAVTRAFYARADLDLILSSPAPVARIFAVRVGAITLAMMLTGVLIAGAFIDVLAFVGGARWLAAYGVVAAGGAAATAIAVGLTVLLFRLIGPQRTRFVAQVLAAIIGAMFVIGLQGAAVLSYGTISRFAVLHSRKLAAVLPSVDSAFWWPARAMMGDLADLAAVAAVCFLLLAAATVLFATRFADHAIAAAGAPQLRAHSARRRRFRRLSAATVLRRKEWLLLLRDPWLVSQTLMQLLYLLPPALLLWLKLGEDGDGAIVIVPVLVVAAGQLAGGLAWLAVSGEDAPDLVATAPVPPRMVIRAKVEAVLGGIAMVSAPLLFLLALSAPFTALLTALIIMAAAIEATAIQLLFRAQAKRSHFRRRQTSSRIATFAEAFSSMAWAATAGLAVSGTWFAVATAVIAVGILGIARLLRPHDGGAPRRGPVAVPSPA